MDDEFLRLLWLLIRLRLKHDSSRSFFEKWHTWLDEFVTKLNKGSDKNLGLENREEMKHQYYYFSFILIYNILLFIKSHLPPHPPR
ncbi:unnamed protein product [Prunus armeniaca]|uniref:Uncharacterized protein n=1 Tax=Prunus armeniaca TaxID=36596 RepID=A0A6J5VVP1_PRUAR|nr:unnamed protein product [Prunus armeniaca]CAB4293106.1 unnamed protein product [Prunus armeniaca]